MTESALVSCEWLRQNLELTNQVILDATFFLPRQQRNAMEEYHQHIPGALFFDIDEIADLTASLPHTLPDAKQFADAVGEMGIDNNTHVVIYDNNHFFAAARVWWMFRVFGHDKVRILNGGLTRWLFLSFPIDSEQLSPTKQTFKARCRPELVLNLQQMVYVQQSNSRQILDARSADSFLGKRKHSGQGLQPGHIPGSINIPYASLTNREQQNLLSKPELLELFNENHVNLSQPLVTTCGSGVSAAVLALALFQIGLTEVPMYDGSWAEWGRQIDTPKLTAT